MRRVIRPALVAGILAVSTTAIAGEIKGPPTGVNRPDSLSISNGLSRCSFSGLNDTPEGLGSPGDPEYDPGGITQSYGSFLTQGLFDPSDPAQRDGFAFPAMGCNPQHTGGTRQTATRDRIGRTQ